MSNTPTAPKPLAPGDRQLTPHFRLSEFAVSAAHPDLVRPVPKELHGRVLLLAEQLEIVRMRHGHALRILSGYRSSTLNKAVDGSKTSQHVVAEAADVTCVDPRKLFEDAITLVKEGKLPMLGQIIYYPERGFVHFALASRRFPTATLCVHWPEKGYKYRPIGPSRFALNQLVPLGDGTVRA